MIVGGGSTGQLSRSRKTYLKVVQNVQLFGRSSKTRTTDEQSITFTDEDATRIHHPHDYVIVITLLIADYSTRRVLVDNGSSADILYYPAFQQRTRATSSSAFTLSWFWWNESATCWYYLLTYGSGGISATGNKKCELPRS